MSTQAIASSAPWGDSSNVALPQFRIHQIAKLVAAEIVSATAMAPRLLHRRMTVGEFAVCIQRGAEYVRRNIRARIIPKDCLDGPPYLIHPRALKLFGVTPEIAAARLEAREHSPMGVTTTPSVDSLPPKIRGVRRFEIQNKPSRFAVQWSTKEVDPASGKFRPRVNTRFFRTAADRNLRATEIIEARRNGVKPKIWSQAELGDFAAFKAAIGDTPWQNVVAGWRSHLADSGSRVL